LKDIGVVPYVGGRSKRVSWLTESIPDKTVAWLVLSKLVGAVLGAGVRFLAEDVLRPRLGVSHETRRVLRRFSTPLVRSAESLERRINILVRNEDKNWFTTDEYMRLSTLYIVGEHLGWVRIIERQFGFLPFESARRGRELNRRLTGIFRALSSHAYFRWHPDQGMVSDSTVPRLMLTAIGEAMTVDGDPPKVLEFTEFAIRYTNDDQFRRWFAEVAVLFTKAHPDDPLHWDRLIAAGANLRALTTFLDSRQALVSRRPVANLRRMRSAEAREILRKETT